MSGEQTVEDLRREDLGHRLAMPFVDGRMDSWFGSRVAVWRRYWEEI